MSPAFSCCCQPQRGRISERCEEVKAATLRAVERVQSEAEEEAERLVALEAERLASLQADEDAVDTDLEVDERPSMSPFPPAPFP